MIVKQGSKYVLKSKDGSRVLGRHDSKKKALAQERAIEGQKRIRK